MRDIQLFRWFYILFLIFVLFSSCINGKGFSSGRGRIFKSGGSFGGSKGAGSFGKSSIYGGSSMSKPRTGGSFRSNAMSFGAGAVGGLAAYSLMRSMSSSYYAGPGYYQPGYGYGETCTNNEDINGTRFGRFRCPLNGFPIEAKDCCGEYGKQYCCVYDRSYRLRGSSNLGWIFLILIICFIAIFLFAKHRQRTQKNIIIIPVEPTANEQAQPFYQPPPPHSGNPYATTSQHFNPNPNPPPYPVQQQGLNPYLVREVKPPAYEEVVRNNQGAPTGTSY